MDALFDGPGGMSVTVTDEEAARALASLDIPQILHGHSSRVDNGGEGDLLLGAGSLGDGMQGVEPGSGAGVGNEIDPSLAIRTDADIDGDEDQDDGDDASRVIVKTEASDDPSSLGYAAHAQQANNNANRYVALGGFDTSSSRGSDRFSMVRGLSTSGVAQDAGGGGGTGNGNTSGGAGPRRDGPEGVIVNLGGGQTSSERYGAGDGPEETDGIEMLASGAGAGGLDRDRAEAGYIIGGPIGTATGHDGVALSGSGGQNYLPPTSTNVTTSASGRPIRSTRGSTAVNIGAGASFQVPNPPTATAATPTPATRASKRAAASHGGPPNKKRGTGTAAAPGGGESATNARTTRSGTNPAPSARAAGTEGLNVGNDENDANNSNNDNNNNNMLVASAHGGASDQWWNNPGWDESRQEASRSGAGGGQAGELGGAGSAGNDYGLSGMQHDGRYTGDSSPGHGTSVPSSNYIGGAAGGGGGGVYPSDPTGYNQWGSGANDPNGGGEIGADADMWKSYYDGNPGSGGNGGGGGVGPGGVVGVNTENLEQYLLEPMSNNGTLSGLADPNSHGSPDDGRADSLSSGSRSESGAMRPRSGIPDDLRDSLSNQPYSRSPELRVSHKLAERKRRREMKDLFDELRDCLPNDRAMKASKWEILSKSVDFIQNMKKHNESMGRELEVLRRENERMRLETASVGSGGGMHNTLSGAGAGGYSRAQPQYPAQGPTPPLAPTPGNGPVGGFVPPLQVQPRTSPFSGPAATLSTA